MNKIWQRYSKERRSGSERERKRTNSNIHKKVVSIDVCTGVMKKTAHRTARKATAIVTINTVKQS